MSDFEARVTKLAALGEPLRRALYRFVARAGHPVSRDQAASGVGVPRHVAKFHLDKLEQDGLLDVEFKRPPGRSGPGAGRPTKLYRRSPREVAVSLPERRYDLAGRIMASAIAASQGGDTPLPESLRQSAAGIGHSLGEEAKRDAGTGAEPATLLAAAAGVLDEQGYEARVVDGCITLENCPFHALAQDYTELVCGINVDFVQGLLDAFAGTALEASLEPAPDRCCVVIREA